jgi:ribosomal protein S14
MAKRYNIEEDGVVYSYVLDREGNFVLYQESHQQNDDDEGEEQQAEPERTLKRLGKAAPPRASNVPQGMRRCEVCGALVPRSRLDEHMQTKHSETEEQQASNSLERCPECGVEVRADRLEKHLHKVHDQ